jgi:hypothetical protein
MHHVHDKVRNGFPKYQIHGMDSFGSGYELLAGCFINPDELHDDVFLDKLNDS